ncbi:MAG TPA: FAD-binding protein [Candidatus Dormibacteraeota bacterium]|nr:FAD-binding protein [Candidatus Dormibacteraeota bacterium]
MNVVVIGGGIAAYMAALSARREGADVTVIAKAPGATALYAGAMEIVDDLDAVLKTQPNHPFARLGMDAVRLATELDNAVATLSLALRKDGIELAGTWRERGLYADIHGIARPGNLVPSTVAPGELRALNGKRVTVVGVREVGDYDAESTAQALKELHGIEAVAEEVSIAELPVAASLTDLYGRRAPATKSRAAFAAYPPGFTGLPEGAFELLASPPSPHGWQLQQALALGMVRGEVVKLDADGASVTSAQTREKAYRADSFVLATGQHIGGGLLKEHPTREPLAGLGVYYDGRPAAQAGSRLQHLEYIDPASAFRIGLRTDNRLHPLDEDGSPPYSNLYAAGAVLGGYDYAGAYGFGVPILTGWLAGRWAARGDS